MKREGKNIFARLWWSILFISTTTTVLGCGPQAKVERINQGLGDSSEVLGADQEVEGDEGADVALNLHQGALAPSDIEKIKAIVASSNKGGNVPAQAPIIVIGPDGTVAQDDLLTLGVWICTWKLGALVDLAKTISKRNLENLSVLEPDTAAQVSVLRPLVKPIKRKYLKLIPTLICPLVVGNGPMLSPVVSSSQQMANIPSNVKVD